MAHATAPHKQRTTFNSLRISAMLATTLMLGACSQMADFSKPELTNVAATQPDNQSGKTELERATEYWGKEYAKNPKDLNSALSYARNLKAMGQKTQALAVLQQASFIHGNDRRLASEYGRLALELDQVKLADQLLLAADDPSSPDWRVISARGTVMAKQGKYAEAIPMFERALTLSDNQPSVLNNLALAYTMSGDAQKAETLLRQAAANSADSSKVRQNLALVVGLQGRHDEQRQIAMQDIGPDAASANADLVRHIVRNDAKGSSAPVTTAGARPTMKPAVEPASSGPAWNSEVAVAR